MEKAIFKQKNKNSDSDNRLKEFLNRLSEEYVPFRDNIIADKDAINFIYEQFLNAEPGLIQSLPDLRKLAHIENTIDVMIEGLKVTDHFENKEYFIEISDTINTINEPIKTIAIKSILDYGKSANVYELLNEIVTDQTLKVPHDKIKPLLLGLRNYIKENNRIVEVQQEPELLLADQLNDHSNKSFEQFNKLNEKFMSKMSFETFNYVIKNKRLPHNQEKGSWISGNVEAYRFIEIFNMKIKEFNDCFSTKKNKLKEHNKPNVPNGEINKCLNIDSPRK